jgi:hypothetical protein
MTINDIQFVMKVRRLQVNPDNGIKENVVHRVDWALFGTYTDPVTGQEYTTSVEDVTTLKFVDAAGYVPFENLDEQTLLTWVQARENQRTRNIEWRKGKVFDLLKEKIKPTNVSIEPDSLPWIQK